MYRVFVTLVVLALTSIQVLGQTCDRACLETILSDYLTALVSHDPSRLPTTSDVKYVENDQMLPLANSLGTYRHIFSDPVSSQVAAITTLMEKTVRIIYIVRLKLSPVPAAQRISRAELIAQTNKYYSGMERNDPRGNYSFFDTSCNRLEDGLQTTNQRTGAAYGHSNDTTFASLGCEAQFQTGFLGFVTRIRDRRFPVVDEERQSTLPDPMSPNGTQQPIPRYFDVPRSLLAAEAFRLRASKLFCIEMTLTEVPYGMRYAFRGRGMDLPGMGTNLTVASPCDRGCLLGVLNRTLEAMAMNDTVSIPLASGIRYSENGQFLAPGDGLWETLGQAARPGVDEYAAVFADPESGTAAYWGGITEHTTPGVLGLRVKVDYGKIIEIEAIAVRAESTGARGGTMTLMRPPLPVEWEGDDSLGGLDPTFQRNAWDSSNTNVTMSALTTAYLDGLENHSSAFVPLTSKCTRRDNGVQTNLSCAEQLDGKGPAPNGLSNMTTAVRDRRVLVADANKGVMMAVAMVDDPATSPLAIEAADRVPSTFMVLQLIKVGDGKIARVEGMVKWMPFGYTSAWAELAR
ncbi:hypothetical protein QBC46DRAFT_441861 [Diplogelasinospora grovesii]|uniref:DUF8021 domain-containing protein n=1 Tax=Diplogelasinospora grovesii TaxID=303347 RepID=A0AAN6N2I6_9PEZI|nr:hypothetical protein QBC46DRAFT_441861 [Diplogelasinospora grovesii]